MRKDVFNGPLRLVNDAQIPWQPERRQLSNSKSFSDDERQGLQRLRDRYQRTGDNLTDRELARLEFIRWIYRRGRLDP